MIHLEERKEFSDGLYIGVVKLSDLKLDPSNPRRHGAVVGEIVKSIDRYGYLVPIVVDSDGLILAGHARYKALRRIKADKCSCVLLSNADGYNLIDNAVSDLADWDFERLGVELRSLESMNGLFSRVDKFFDQLVNNSLDLDSEGKVSSGDVTKANDKVCKSGPSKNAATGDLVKVVCRDCGEVFYIRRRFVDYVK